MSLFKRNGQQQDLMRGHWTPIQITPNIATEERINIGVAMIDQNGIMHARMANDLERLKCLYETLDVEAFENGLSAMQAIMEGAHVQTFQEVNLFENIHFGDPKSAKGDSHEEILAHLFKQMVPMAKTIKKERKAKFHPIRTSELRTDVFNRMREKLGNESKQLIHASRWEIKAPGENKPIYVDLPLRSSASCKAGTIVSAWYSSDEKVKLSLYQAALDIRTARDYLTDEKFGLFMLRPDDNSGLSKSTLYKIDSAIDEQADRLDRLGVTIETTDNAEELSEKASNWIAVA